MPSAVVCERLGLGHLGVVDRDSEPLGAGSVRVGIAAVSLNHRDLLVVRGRYSAAISPPLIPCSDAAGRILEVGPEVTGLAVGQRVCTHMTPDWIDGPIRPEVRATTLGGPADGVLAEERVLPAGAVAPIPDSLAFEHAACLPVAGLTAWNALGHATDRDGETTVLAIGTGGLGTMGLQLAKLRGYRVAVASSSEEKQERAKGLGADLGVDRSDPAWPEKVRAWSGGGVDLVLDVGGTVGFNASLRSTRDGGCVAVIGALGNGDGSVGLADLLMRGIRAQGIFVGSRSKLESLIDFAGRHGFEPVIDRSFDGLGEARQAFAHLQSGGHFGKVVIRVGGA